MPFVSKLKERFRGRGKSPAATPAVSPEIDNAPPPFAPSPSAPSSSAPSSSAPPSTAPPPSAPPGSLSVPLAITSVAGRNSAGPVAAVEESLTHEREDESLWDRAYKALDKDMVAEYDAVLAEVVKEQGTTTAEGGKTATQERINEASQRGKTAYEAKKLQYSIFNKTLVASKLVSDATSLINRFKPIIDEAVKASSAASFAWVGVSLAFGILANPQGVHGENLDGLAKVTSKMHYYTAIEPLLLRKKQDHGIDVAVYGEIEKHVVDLYTNILDFECRSALRFYSPRLRRVWKDARRADDWKGMLGKIETSEEVLRARSSQALALITAEDQRAAAERAADILSDTRRQLEAQTETLRAMLDLEKKKELFEKVPLVPGALYSSYEDRATPQCQEDTRVATLAEINDWIQMPGSRGVFWLNGPAGSGKSTISKTVATSLDDKGLLAASYFFRQPDRRMADKIFSTISRQLIDSIPGFGVELYKTLETATAPVSNLRHDLQCKMLITDPLSGLGAFRGGRDAPGTRMVVVIDGLDECDSDIEVLCDLLCSLPEVVTGRILVFLASRDIRSIKDAINARDDYTYKELNLLGKTEESVSDITAFVTKEFNKMAKKRPNNAVLNDGEVLSRVIALCTTPSPLFVFASTLCRSVSRNTSPSYQLKKWLDDRKNTAQGSRLDELYASVIRQALFGDEGGARYDESQRGDALKLIGSLLFLSQPQSSASLAALLGLDPDSVNDMLDDFRPVLAIPDNDHEPIQILHTSFVEFLRGHTVSDLQDFVADEEAVHSMLLQRCIIYMAENLKRDICELRDPATSIADVDRCTLDAHIPAALQYACVFWSSHMTKINENASTAVLDFLKDHLLHWIEVMALLGKIVDATLSTRKLATLAEGELRQFIDDIIMFLEAYGISMIREYPLQVYGGALVWCPTNNMVRSTQWKHRLPFIESANSNVNNAELRPSPMEGHQDMIIAVAFSPKTDVLASCSHDGTVRLWDTKAQYCIKVLQINDGPVTSVAYSPDGETLVTTSARIQLWSTSDYELRRTIELNRIRPLSAIFVPGSDDLFAYMADDTVRAWNYKTGEAREHQGATLVKLDPVTLAVSPNSRLLAVSGGDVLFLFDTKTLSALHRWNSPGRMISLNFSSDSQTVITAISRSGLYLWSTTSYARNTVYVTRFCHSFALSNDGQLLAFRDVFSSSIVYVYSVDDTLARMAMKNWVEQIDTMLYAQPRVVHRTAKNEYEQQMCFSPDSKQLALPNNHHLMLADLSRNTVADTGNKTYAIRYSRDHQTLVAISAISVSVWDIADCRCLFVLPGHAYCGELSPNGQHLAVGHSECISLLPWPQPKAASSTLAGTAYAYDDRIKLTVDREVDSAAGLENGSVMAVSIAFSADSKTLAVGSPEGSIRLWDVSTREHFSSTCGDYPRGSCFTGIAFSDDGLLLVACQSKNSTRADSVILVYEVSGNTLKLAVGMDSFPVSYWPEFWPGSQGLNTQISLIDEKDTVDPTKTRPHTPETVYLVGRWLVRDGVRLLRLPVSGEKSGFPGLGVNNRIVLPFVEEGFVIVTLVPSSQGG